MGESSAYLLFGWFKHGGLTGVSAATSCVPGVVELLNALLSQAHPTGEWTTLGLFFSAAAAPHVDRRNAKNTSNYILPLALPPTEQYMWVQKPLGSALDPLTWLNKDGSVLQGFRLPLRANEPVCVDPHSLHALPTPLPHENHCDHVLLVGFSVPRLHRPRHPKFIFCNLWDFDWESVEGESPPLCVRLSSKRLWSKREVFRIWALDCLRDALWKRAIHI